jgi:N-acetylmuramoyl-L-alanine amidase
MHWISRIALLLGFALAVFAALSSIVSGAPEKHLSVYSVAANYSLTLVQREGHDYVGLLELLEPLGKVTARSEGSRWRIRYNRVEGDFQSGKTRARVQGHDIELTEKFVFENERGYVPVSSLTSLLPRFLGGPVTLHEETGRLFVGNVATHFTASMAAGTSARLVFNFTAPVSPSIINEAGSVRLVFTRDAVVSPASPSLTFGSKLIPSATYSENNGAALLVVKTTVPVTANLSNDGHTITIAPSSAPAVAQKSPTASPSATTPVEAGTQPASVPPQAVTPTASTPVNRRYFAVVDASHGGADYGETLSSTLYEKDITVALARSLRQELESRGITTLVLRDSDANLSLDQRAVFANADRAAIYIALHAASDGPGVRVYTALLPFGEEDRGPFRNWDTAQHASLSLSQAAAAAVANELQKRQIPVRDLTAPLRPLNNITGPAIAIEVAPEGNNLAQLTAPDYQQLITSAVATAIAADRNQLGVAP